MTDSSEACRGSNVNLSSCRVAAIVPCHNEALTIAKVVNDLRAAVPECEVYVYDNLSTDGTDEVARGVDAHVRYESFKGKGNVVRRAFGDIDADIYVLIDGDDTYDAGAVAVMIKTLFDGPFDHVVGVRQDSSVNAYRSGHRFGNAMFNKLVSVVFGVRVTDMLSGCRVVSRRFVKSFPAVSREFEIETELTVHTSNLRLAFAEVPVGYRERHEGSHSKLNTVEDGAKILSLIFNLVRHERPVFFHSVIAVVLMLAALALGLPIIVEYAETGLVPRLPTAVLASSLVILSVLTFAVGLVLEGIAKTRREAARLNYLRYPAPMLEPRSDG